MNNRRGVSSAVATVLIILITIAAVTIVWQFVIPMITNSLEDADKCLDVISDISIVKDYTTYNETTIKVSLEVKRLTEIEKAIIRITNEQGDAITKIVEKVDLPEIGGRKSYFIDFSEKEWPKGSIVEKVGVAPIILKGNKEEICTFDEITLSMA